MIEPYVHRCVVQCVGQDGRMARNKTRLKVEPYEVEYGYTCDFCKEPLATPEQIIAHIYEQLLPEEVDPFS